MKTPSPTGDSIEMTDTCLVNHTKQETDKSASPLTVRSSTTMPSTEKQASQITSLVTPVTSPTDPVSTDSVKTTIAATEPKMESTSEKTPILPTTDDNHQSHPLHDVNEQSISDKANHVKTSESTASLKQDSTNVSTNSSKHVTEDVKTASTTESAEIKPEKSVAKLDVESKDTLDEKHEFGKSEEATVEKKATISIAETKVDPVETVTAKSEEATVEKKATPSIAETKVDPVETVTAKSEETTVEKKATPSIAETKVDPVETVTAKSEEPTVEKKATISIAETKVDPVETVTAKSEKTDAFNPKEDVSKVSDSTTAALSKSTAGSTADLSSNEPRYSSIYRNASFGSTPVLAAPTARSAEHGPPVPTSAITAAVRATNPILDEILHSLALINANDPLMTQMDIKDCNCFTVEHACVLGEALKQNTHLKSLVMSNSKIINQSAIDIARGLAKNTGIESVDLTGNNIGPAGMRALAEMLESNHTLLELKLDHQKSITSTGTDAEQAFARAMTKNNTLQKLAMQFRDAASRNQVDRAISRNKETARKLISLSKASLNA
ncbi:hypothetical protein BDV3_003395 [Batrachochytrium dendrobatidis]|uniref:Uncharacterized protein n=1 Tax=Batrachochytrium dendrobatidis (strain JEL423) TaxID=403673 RepID=A0A177WDK0_BATDL|nr:hypothetical protein BDEG_21746 [Batrachochytrium dendrobatidis JEL423]